MTYPAAISRRYKTRDQVRAYLTSRGFSPGLDMWRNGRWLARAGRDTDGFWVEVWLPAE